MIRLASQSSLEQVAWAAFDEAALRLKEEYDTVRIPDTLEARTRRFEMSMEVVRRWDAWRTMFVSERAS